MTVVTVVLASRTVTTTAISITLIAAAQTPSPKPDVIPQQSGVGIWFVVSCILLPVVWGMIVHQVFKRLRKSHRPKGSREQTGNDFQI